MNVFRTDILRDRVALVTGGGTGIGKVITRTLGRHGAGVVIVSRRQDVLDAAAGDFRKQGISCLPLSADVRDPRAMEIVVSRTLDRFGRLDIVVNNAAGNFPALLKDISFNGFKTIVDIDLLGTYNVTRVAFHAWLKDHGGCIVNITAPFHQWGVSYQGHVAAAKAGVDALTRTCAVEWAPLGIRVNAVAPGGIAKTEGMQRLKETQGLSAACSTSGTRQDVANAVLFLLSPAAAFINGVCLRVDGGAGIDFIKAPFTPEKPAGR